MHCGSSSMTFVMYMSNLMYSTPEWKMKVCFNQPGMLFKKTKPWSRQFIKQQPFSLTVLEAETSKTKMPADALSVRALPSLLLTCRWLCLSSYKDTNPTVGPPASWPSKHNDLPKGPTWYHPQGLRLQYMSEGGDPQTSSQNTWIVFHLRGKRNDCLQHLKKMNTF
jgi:hypothetical protein